MKTGFGCTLSDLCLSRPPGEGSLQRPGSLKPCAQFTSGCMAVRLRLRPKSQAPPEVRSRSRFLPRSRPYFRVEELEVLEPGSGHLVHCNR